MYILLKFAKRSLRDRTGTHCVHYKMCASELSTQTKYCILWNERLLSRNCWKLNLHVYPWGHYTWIRFIQVLGFLDFWPTINFLRMGLEFWMQIKNLVDFINLMMTQKLDQIDTFYPSVTQNQFWFIVDHQMHC